MSTLRVDTITDEAGTGPVEFTNGINVSGGTVTGVLGKAIFSVVQVISSDTTLDSGDNLDVISITADLKLTLPTPADGLVYAVVNETNTDIIISTGDPDITVNSIGGAIYLEAYRNGIIIANGDNWNMVGFEGTAALSVRVYTGSATYIPPAGCTAFIAMLTGATGGMASGGVRGGSGGGGYAEKIYTAPFAASYPFTIGSQGGTAAAGGTTTFGPMTITSSAGVTGSAGTSGGVASGGDYNVNGGNGGNGSTKGGGAGGAGSRAGSGGNGAAGTGSLGGGGGGCNGNASGSTGGAAATVDNAGASSIYGLANPVFKSGGNGTISSIISGGNPAVNVPTYTLAGVNYQFGIWPSSSYTPGGGSPGLTSSFNGGNNGGDGQLVLLEFYG